LASGRSPLRVGEQTLCHSKINHQLHRDELLGIVGITRTDTPKNVTIEAYPHLPPDLLNSETILLKDNGEQLGTINQITQKMYETRKDELNREISGQFLEHFKTVEDIGSKNLTSEFSLNPNEPLFIKSVTGGLHRVINLILTMTNSFSYQPTAANHYLLGGSQVTMGTAKDERGKDFSIMVIQDSDKPKQAKIHIEVGEGPKIIKRHPKRTKKNS
jgi:hypothetical protein